MQIIKKVLNSSVVLVEDERGMERVLLGKGIGFGANRGDLVREGSTDRVFVALDDIDQRNFVELLASIPGEFVELSRTIVAEAAAAGLDLDPHVYLALTDHLHFVVERHRRGMHVVNRLAWELKTVYPVEYGIGLRAVHRMRSGSCRACERRRPPTSPFTSRTRRSGARGATRSRWPSSCRR